MSAFNAIAALAILSNSRLKISQDQATLGVGTAAIINGTVGLLPPLLIAQQAQGNNQFGTKGQFGASAPAAVVVPDVSSNKPLEAAAKTTLQAAQLVAVEVRAFTAGVDDTGKAVDDTGKVVGQDPPAGSQVPLGSNVTIVVSDGSPPPVPVTDQDLDTDLTSKINAATTELEGKIADNTAALARIEAKLGTTSPVAPAPAPAPVPVVVPDVSSNKPLEAAAKTTLQAAQLVAVEVRAFTAGVDDTGKAVDDTGKVVGQDPPAGSQVPLGSNVTIVVSDGSPPPVPVTDQDLDTDLTSKINAATTELEGKIADNTAALTRIEAKLGTAPAAADPALAGAAAKKK